jgi:hypothetical protein
LVSEFLLGESSHCSVPTHVKVVTLLDVYQLVMLFAGTVTYSEPGTFSSIIFIIYCNVLSYGHRCATAAMEIVEFPQRQIVTTDCLLSNNEGNGTRYSISVITRGSLRNSEVFDETLHNEVEYSPRYS